MRQGTKTMVTRMVAASALFAMLSLASCGSDETEEDDTDDKMVCCDDPNSRYCSCFEGQTCSDGDTKVQACPDYGSCCREMQSGLCACLRLSCSDLPYSPMSVSGCP